jgi:hypothetical protein
MRLRVHRVLIEDNLKKKVAFRGGPGLCCGCFGYEEVLEGHGSKDDAISGWHCQVA